MHIPKWIMLEGPDRSGKTTCYDTIFYGRDMVDVISDRGVLTSAFFHPSVRGVEYHIQILKNWLALPSSRLIVFHISYDTQKERIEKSGHKSVDFESYLAEMSFYSFYGLQMRHLYPEKVLLLDANKKQEIVDSKILEFLNKDEINV